MAHAWRVRFFPRKDCTRAPASQTASSHHPHTHHVPAGLVCERAPCTEPSQHTPVMSARPGGAACSAKLVAVELASMLAALHVLTPRAPGSTAASTQEAAALLIIKHAAVSAHACWGATVDAPAGHSRGAHSRTGWNLENPSTTRHAPSSRLQISHGRRALIRRRAASSWSSQKLVA